MLRTDSDREGGARHCRSLDANLREIDLLFWCLHSCKPCKHACQKGEGKSSRSKFSTRQLLVVPVVPADMRLKMAFSGGFIFLMLGGLQLKATTFNVNIEARDSIL